MIKRLLLSAAGFSAATIGTGIITGLLVGGPVGGIVGMIGPIICTAIVILIVGMGVYIAVEILMVRIEFYMMMLLSLIMLPFAMVDKLSFLSNQAISGVFNSGTKLMVICFLQATITKLLIGYMHTINLQGLIGSISTILQLFVACCLFTYMVKKLPELAAGLLQGNGGMTGQGMLDQTVKIMKTTAMAIGVAGGAVAGGAAMGAGGAAGGAGAMGKGQMAMSAMKNIAQTGAAHLVGKSSIMQGFAKGANAVMGTGSGKMPKGFSDRVGKLLAAPGGSGNLFTDLKETKSGQRAKDEASNGKKGGFGGGGKEKETQMILREMVRNSKKKDLRATFSNMERDALRTAMHTMDKDSRHQVFQAMKEATKVEKQHFVEKLRGGGGPPPGGPPGGGAGKDNDRKKENRQ